MVNIFDLQNKKKLDLEIGAAKLEIDYKLMELHEAIKEKNKARIIELEYELTELSELVYFK